MHADLFSIPRQREVGIGAEPQDRGLEYAVERPGYVLEVSLWSLLRTLNLAGAGTATPQGIYADRGIGIEITRAEPIAFYLAALLAACGAVALLRRQRGHRGPAWIWAVAILLVVPTLPIIGLPRYRAPAEPFLLMLAAIGIVALWDRLRRVVRSSLADRA